MLFFAFLTIGYFAGVITALLIFPPRVKEIEMQEQDASAPINAMERSKEGMISPVSNKLEFDI